MEQQKIEMKNRSHYMEGRILQQRHILCIFRSRGWEVTKLLEGMCATTEKYATTGKCATRIATANHTHGANQKHQKYF